LVDSVESMMMHGLANSQFRMSLVLKTLWIKSVWMVKERTWWYRHVMYWERLPVGKVKV